MTGGAGRPSKLSPERRQEILGAVVALLIERGYADLTVDRVAAMTRASKATLYRHWGDKPNLVVAALAETGGLALSDIDTGTFSSDLERVVEVLAAHAEQNIVLMVALLDASRHDGRLRSSLTAFAHHLLTVLELIATRAAERGEQVNPDLIARLPTLFIGALFTPGIMGDDRPVDEPYLRGFLRDVVLPLVERTTSSE